MLAACFCRPCGPWRAWPRLPWPPLGGLPCKALCPAGKANMAALAKNCKPFFHIFSNFLFLPYILGVYKRPEPRQQGGKRPQARPRGRAPALARGQQGEQGRGPIGIGRRGPACGRACPRICPRARAYAPACPRAWGRAYRAKRSRKAEKRARQAEGRGRGPGGQFSTIYKSLRRTKQLFQSVSKHAKPPPRKIFQNQSVSPCLFLQYMLCKA